MADINEIFDSMGVDAAAGVIKEHHAVLTPNDQTFALDLARRVINGRGLSDKQAFWIRKLAQRIHERMTAAPIKTVELGGMAAIGGMFAKRASARAAIVLDDGVQAIRLQLAGPASRYPGTINVTTQGSYENRTWFGRIHENGSFEGSSRQATPDSVISLLRRFSADPVAVATEHGRRTGSCCFCNRTLNDKRSIEVGYGPICADKFGLEWGVASKAA